MQTQSLLTEVVICFLILSRNKRHTDAKCRKHWSVVFVFFYPVLIVSSWGYKTLQGSSNICLHRTSSLNQLQIFIQGLAFSPGHHCVSRWHGWSKERKNKYLTVPPRTSSLLLISTSSQPGVHCFPLRVRAKCAIGAFPLNKKCV